MSIQQLHTIQFLFFLYAIIVSIFLHFNKNPILKRKVFPYILAILGTLFVGMIWGDSKNEFPLIYVVLAVSLIMILNYKSIDFCSACGKTVFSRNPFKAQLHCGDCGHKMIENKTNE